MSNPTPGSHEAVEAGCTCPVVDNHYGRGIERDGGEYDEPSIVFWYSTGCPLHGCAVIGEPDHG
jgi:hypothetical protein